MVFTDAQRALAHKELSDKLKSKWVVVITLGFTLFTIVISYFGTVTSGVASFRNMAATVASLTSLVIYFIPILALTLGGGIIADERDRHTLELYLSSPISVGEFLSGKYVGLAISLAIPVLLGSAIPGVILIVKTGTSSVGSYILFIINSIIMGLVFLSISFFVSVVFYERSKVIAFTVFLWLLYTILYDLGLVGLLIVTKGIFSSTVFAILLLLNPVDIFRILNFMAIGEYSTLMGMASVELPAFFKAPVLWTISLVWVFLPLGLSYYFFKRKYLI